MSNPGKYIKFDKVFDKLDSFGIEYTNEQTPFKKLEMFDIESICVREKTFKVTKKRR